MRMLDMEEARVVGGGGDYDIGTVSGLVALAADAVRAGFTGNGDEINGDQEGDWFG